MPRTPRRFSVHDMEMLLVTLFWGGNFSVSKFAMRQLPPLAFSAARFFLASVLLVVVARRLKVFRPLPRKTMASLIGLGIVGNTLYQSAFMTGLSLTTATKSAMIVAGLPVMVAVLGTLLGIERTGPAVWLGVILGTLGVALVVTARGIDLRAGSFHGDLLVLGALFCWAFYTVGVRRAGAGVDALQVTAITTVAGTPGLVLLGLPGLVRLDWGGVTPATWGALVYAALLALFFSYIMYNRAVQGIGSARTALYNCLTPLVAMVIAWRVLGEVPTGWQLVGVALVIGGVVVSLLAVRSPEEPVPGA